jgi:hypothetical protein
MGVKLKSPVIRRKEKVMAYENTVLRINFLHGSKEVAGS